MNIFVVHSDPVIAAQSLCDKHIPKMCLESAQLICTAMHRLSGWKQPYASTHINHPCTRWAQESHGNFVWLAEHARALADEYGFRYGRVHACEIVIRVVAGGGHASLFNASEMTPFAQAMPERYRGDDAIEAYRNYYLGEKMRFARWAKGREAPEWARV